MLEQLFLLNKLNLPRKIINKIIKDYFGFINCCNCCEIRNIKNFKLCDSCGDFLCEKHSLSALNLGLYYTVLENYRMCNKCCWKQII